MTIGMPQDGQPLYGNTSVRRFDTEQGSFTTLEVPLGVLGTGDQFIGPDGYTLYEATSDCVISERGNGLLDVRDLSMTEERAAALLAEPGAVEDGYDPRDGSFLYSETQAMHLVLDRQDTTAPTPAQTNDDADGM